MAIISGACRRRSFALLVAAAAVLAGCGQRDDPALVVYCAHDSLYSERILEEFESDSGLRVDVRFDTEATKSLGLVELILRERNRPRCDVFWNNEQLGTMKLQEAGLLVPYQGSGFKRIGPQFKDPGGHWVGFGARMRVWILNTRALEPTEQAVRTAMEGALDRAAIAKPLYGTTRTHYTVLWDLWGPARLQAWHQDLRARGLNEVAGNATVKNLVAAGTCDLGLTDTDDFFIARDANHPVAMVPYRAQGDQVICIPNTVAIIRGTRRLGEAQKLVDFLLSERCELALARSRARQIPLGAVDVDQLPPEVRRLKELAETSVPLNDLGEASAECLAWLRGEYLR